MKAESKLWHSLKKNTPKISWTRLESWASFGVPDLLGYHDMCGFFILLEDTSSRSIKLYGSESIHGLLIDHRETPSLTHNNWEHVQRLLLDVPLDA